MPTTNARRNVAVSLRVKPEIELVWESLSDYLHMNRTQVIEQAILRMGRQEGFIAPPRPISTGRGSEQAAVTKANLSQVKPMSVQEMRSLLNDLAATGPTRSIPASDFGRDVINDDHDR